MFGLELSDEKKINNTNYLYDIYLIIFCYSLLRRYFIMGLQKDNIRNISKILRPGSHKLHGKI